MLESAPQPRSRPDPAPRARIALPAFQRFQLECWAAEAYPHEACGLLLGRRRAGVTEVAQVRRARNVDQARARDRYRLDPADHLGAEDEARELGLEVVGVWHSHPDRPAQPSERDRERAWDGWSYVIVAIDRHAQREVRSWRLEGGRFEEEELRG